MRRDQYDPCMDSPGAFRRLLDQAFQQMPELFPAAFADGYSCKDSRRSCKRGLRLRRIHCRTTGAASRIRPAFVMPSLSAWTDDVRPPLFLPSFGVPFGALAHVCGRDPLFWYRLEVGLGRNSIVGTTVRQAQVPQHLLADEQQQSCEGTKTYLATTVAAGCCLGAAVADTADADALQQAYGVFKLAATKVSPQYRPRTVNTAGWTAPQLAWPALFPLVLILRWFLHGWWSVRERAQHRGEQFRNWGEKVWDAYRAPPRRSFAQRLRRLRDWAKGAVTGVVWEQVLRLCGSSRQYGQA
jgi:hypothetical protein